MTDWASGRGLTRRPERYANQLPEQVEPLLVSTKRGARKIRELLVRKLDGDYRVPSISTVHAVMDRHGLVTHAKRRRAKASGTLLSPGLAPKRAAANHMSAEPCMIFVPQAPSRPVAKLLRLRSKGRLAL